MKINTVSAYDTITLTIGAQSYLNTTLAGHDLALLINAKIRSGELVADWRLLDSGVYGYVVDVNG